MQTFVEVYHHKIYSFFSVISFIVNLPGEDSNYQTLFTGCASVGNSVMMTSVRIIYSASLLTLLILVLVLLFYTQSSIQPVIYSDVPQCNLPTPARGQ